MDDNGITFAVCMALLNIKLQLIDSNKPNICKIIIRITAIFFC